MIDEEGNQLGVMTKSEALAAAEQAELDLVEISPNADPPVAKIVDWGKFNYQRTKQLQKNKRNAKNLEVKQMRVGLKISDHDLEVKAKKVRGFLEEGHKVKYILRYRGRELAHKDIGFTLAKKLLIHSEKHVVVDQSSNICRQTANIRHKRDQQKCQNSKPIVEPKTVSVLTKTEKFCVVKQPVITCFQKRAKAASEHLLVLK